MRSLDVWLLGDTRENFDENLFLTKRAVLEVLLFFFKIRGELLSESYKITTDKIIEFAKKRNIKTPCKCNLVTKVKTLYLKYDLLVRLKNRHTETEIRKRCIFAEEIAEIFAFAKSPADKENDNEKAPLKKKPSTEIVFGKRKRTAVSFKFL